MLEPIPACTGREAGNAPRTGRQSIAGQIERRWRAAKETDLNADISPLQLHTEDRDSIPGPVKTEFGLLTWSTIIGSPLRGRTQEELAGSAHATAPGAPRNHASTS